MRDAFFLFFVLLVSLCSGQNEEKDSLSLREIVLKSIEFKEAKEAYQNWFDNKKELIALNGQVKKMLHNSEDSIDPAKLRYRNLLYRKNDSLEIIKFRKLKLLHTHYSFAKGVLTVDDFEF